MNAFDDFKRQERIWGNVFCYVKVCIFLNCIPYTKHWVETQMFKQTSFGQNKRYKECLLFSFASSNSLQFYFLFSILLWAGTQVSPLWNCGGEFSIFNFVLFLLKSYVIIPFKINTIEKLRTVLLRDFWFLSCKKKF